MSKRAETIKRLLEMQKKFMAYEKAHGVGMGEYFNPPKGHELYGYADEYQALAKDLVDMAHADVGSKR